MLVSSLSTRYGTLFEIAHSSFCTERLLTGFERCVGFSGVRYLVSELGAFSLFKYRAMLALTGPFGDDDSRLVALRWVAYSGIQGDGHETTR